MSAGFLFEHFDRISSAPDAIPRLRRFILDLAVCGRLIEQSSRDEAYFLAGGSSSPREGVPQNCEADHLCSVEIPTSWQWRNLERLSEQITDGEHATPPRIHDQQVPLITAKNVRDGFMDYDDTDWVSFDTANKAWSRCHPRAGDVLLVCVGATTGRLCVLRETRDMVLVRSVALIRPNSLINVDYLALALRSSVCQRQIWQKVKVTAQPCLYINRIQSLSIPLPPASEQHRIVTKVDELMALCDRFESVRAERESRRDRLMAATLHHVNNCETAEAFAGNFHFYLNQLPRLTIFPAQIKHLRQTVLNLAVKGKLVVQDSNDEPAAELVERIEVQKAGLLGNGTLRKTKLCRSFNTSDVPHDIPASWKWTMLGQITDIGTGSTPSRTQPAFWNGSIPWIASGSTSLGVITEGDEYVTEAAVKAHRLRLYRPGTLLVALYGQGKTRGQVAELGIQSTINQACAAVCSIPGFELIQPYLKLLLKRNYDEVRSFSAGGAQPNLNVQKIKELLVPLPPIPEQERIVAKVDQLMDLCDRLETQLAASQAELRHLLDAALNEALASDKDELNVA